MTQQQVIQATCVAIEGRALMIKGDPGCGKSSLALALIDRGAQLIGDDGVTLEPSRDCIVASPPPNIAGKLEVRNVGILTFPTVTAPLALILYLSDNAPRFREGAETSVILGVPIPKIDFSPGQIVPAVRAEWALRVHGLAFGG